MKVFSVVRSISGQIVVNICLAMLELLPFSDGQNLMKTDIIIPWYEI